MLFVAASFIFTRCEIYEDIDVLSLNKVQLGKIEKGNLNLTINAEVLNPNTYGIKLKETNLEVFLDEYFVGTAELINPVKLKRKQSLDYSFDVKLNLEKGIMQKLFLLAFKKEALLKVKGDIKASVLGVSKRMKVSKTKTIDPSKIKR